MEEVGFKEIPDEEYQEGRTCDFCECDLGRDDYIIVLEQRVYFTCKVCMLKLLLHANQ